MRIVLLVWAAAVTAGLFQQNIENVPEYEHNTTGCRHVAIKKSTNALKLYSPVAAVSAFSFLGLAESAPDVAGISGLGAVALAFDFGVRQSGATQIAVAALVALSANVAIARLEAQYNRKRIAAAGKTGIAALAAYLAFENESLVVPGMLALVPVLLVMVDKSESRKEAALAALLAASAGTAAYSVSRDDGICTNDVALNRRQDWAHGFALLLWNCALQTLWEPHTSAFWAGGLVATATAVIAMAISGFVTGWATLGATAAVALSIALGCDEFGVSFHNTMANARKFNRNFIWEVSNWN